MSGASCYKKDLQSVTNLGVFSEVVAAQDPAKTHTIEKGEMRLFDIDRTNMLQCKLLASHWHVKSVRSNGNYIGIDAGHLIRLGPR